MKKMLLFVICTIFLIGLIGLTSAELSFFQQKYDKGNKTILNHMVFCYYDSITGIDFLDPVNNYVSGGKSFEAYIWYSIYVQSFNLASPNHNVDWCNFLILQSSTRTNNSVLFNQTFTQADTDMNDAKFFVSMRDGDCVTAQQLCKYDYNVTILPVDRLTIPVNMQLVAPTWECKACQNYEWSATESNIIKAKNIGDKVVSISDYIKRLFLLNFEILLALFWVFLILMIFVALGFIFLGVYWLYIYLKGVVK
jgi:hypothetical protein